jgi:hypothetical protein
VCECECEFVRRVDGVLSEGGVVAVVGDGLTFGWVSKQCQAAARSLRSLSVRLVDDILGSEWVGFLSRWVGIVLVLALGLVVGGEWMDDGCCCECSG